MEHKNLTLEYDKNLIDNILDNVDMRYIILFMYIIRNDLFKDLIDNGIIESYERVLVLDEIFKNNVVNFWGEEFIEDYIDLGLIKNVRSVREFQQKDDDFILKLGEETITIENDTISVPDDTLYLIINKKFKSLTRRNFNLALTRLKGVRCEKSSIIHPLIFGIGEHDYTLSDDFYYILDQYGNIYQAIKIEVTIEGFYQRFNEIQEKINKFIKIFEPALNTKTIMKKITKAIEESKDIIQYLKDEKVELSDKFNFDNINKNDDIYQKWNSLLLTLLKTRNQIEQLDKKLIELKNNYSGKNKKYRYLEFIEKISFNEDEIVDNIQNSLIDYRKELVKINEVISKITEKELKLLNLDYERLIIMSSED
ncbi:MAG: hypothetical protein KAW51_02480 [Candidatus Lokiarchaeota archaeon]|nr:hypothetical protein [Candidatus Lokiarchaeota archaeon]